MDLYEQHCTYRSQNEHEQQHQQESDGHEQDNQNKEYKREARNGNEKMYGGPGRRGSGGGGRVTLLQNSLEGHSPNTQNTPGEKPVSYTHPTQPTKRQE